MATVTLNTGELAVALRIATATDETLDGGLQGVLDRHRDTAKAMVERYAPDAPETVLNEAAIRVAGFLYDRPPEQANRAISAMLHSGAQALLVPWRNPGLGLT